MIDRSAAWKIYSQRPGPTHVLAKMTYGDESKYLPIGSGLVNLEGDDFLPLIMNMPHRFQDVDFWTREFSVADMPLEIMNLPFHGSTRFSDLFDERGSGNDIGFENRPVDVRLWRPGITTWDDCFKLFPVGVMRKPSVRGSVAIVEIQDHTFLTLQNVQLARLQDTDAADTVLGLPEESAGKVKPIIRGNHILYKGDNSKALDTTSPVNNLVPCLYLGMESVTGRHQWFVAGNILNEINNDSDESEQQQLWAWDEDLKRSVRVATEFTVEQNTAVGCIISLPDTIQYFDYWYPFRIALSTKLGTATVFPAPNNTVDKDFTTSSTGSVDAGSAPGDHVRLTTSYTLYDNYEIPDADIVQIKIHLFGLITLGGGAGAADFKFEAASQAFITKPIGASYPDARVSAIHAAATKAAISQTTNIQLEKAPGVAAGELASLEVYQSYKQIKYTKNKLMPMFFGGKGDEIIADISDRGAHADNGAAGDLAENLATLIELTLRNDAGLSASRLNLDSFDAASNDVPGLLGAPVFLEQPDPYLQALFSLVQQYRGFIWWNPEGELFLKILEDDYTSPGITIDGNLITSLKYGRTDINRLYTAVQILYNEIGGLNLLETDLVKDATAQLWYNIIQGESLLKHPAHGFNHTISAESISDYFLANQMNIHSTVECELPIMFNHLDIGDLVGFENLPEDVRGHDLSASYTIAGQTIRPYFLIHSADHSDVLNFKAFQIHKLD